MQSPNTNNINNDKKTSARTKTTHNKDTVEASPKNNELTGIMEKLVAEMKNEIEETRKDNLQLRKGRYILEKTNKDFKVKVSKKLHDKLLKTRWRDLLQ